ELVPDWSIRFEVEREGQGFDGEAGGFGPPRARRVPLLDVGNRSHRGRSLVGKRLCRRVGAIRQLPLRQIHQGPISVNEFAELRAPPIRHYGYPSDQWRAGGATRAPGETVAPTGGTEHRLPE